MKLNKFQVFKDLFKIRLTFEKTLLLVIFLLLVVPYIPKGYQSLINWREDQIRLEQQKKEEEKQQIARKTQDDLLANYGIKTLIFSYSYINKDDIYTYEVPEEVFKYLRIKQDIKNNRDHFNCEQPPRIEDYKTQSNYFPQTNVKLKAIEIDLFLIDCEHLEKLKPTYESFVSELPKIERLINDNKGKSDIAIQALIKKLQEDLLSYEKYNVK